MILVASWGQHYHQPQPQRGYPYHQSKHICSLPSWPTTTETWEGSYRKRLFNDEGGGYCSDDENLRRFNSTQRYMDSKYYYDSDDSFSK